CYCCTHYSRRTANSPKGANRMNGHTIGQDKTFAKPMSVVGGTSYPCTPSSSQRGCKLTIVRPTYHKKEVTAFLRSRRDRITPEHAVIIVGARRQVDGL